MKLVITLYTDKSNITIILLIIFLQVYVHRSGRTARANQKGTTVSIVSPEDIAHHKEICKYLGCTSFPVLSIDVPWLPLLRQRVKLAKQVKLI